jgi:hypothetical protein
LCGLEQNKNCSFLNWTPLLSKVVDGNMMGTI